MKDHRIFVFGSNLGGRHGKGAALFAKKYRGAIQGQAEGLQGQSYAIPTKNHRLDPIELELVWKAIARFLLFAEQNPHLHFQMTPVGCGLAGYLPEQMAWLFVGCPDNIDLPEEFKKLLTDE